MGLAGREFTTLRSLVDAAKRYEGMMEERKKLDVGRSDNRGNKNNKGQGQGKNSGSKRSGSTAGFSSQKPSKSSRSEGGSSGFSGCFRCGKPGHRIKDCTEVALCHICKVEGHSMTTCPQTICYNCGAKGHISPNCPTIKNANTPAPSVVGSTQTPAAGRGRGQNNNRNAGQGQGRGQRGQLNAMETTTAPGDTNFLQGMLPLQGTFVSVLFDTGASKSFISELLVERLKLVVRPLQPPMTVTLPTGRAYSTDVLCPGCTLTIAESPFVYDFIVFDMFSYDLILGLDWLTHFKAHIICDQRRIELTTPSGEMIKYTNERLDLIPYS